MAKVIPLKDANGVLFATVLANVGFVDSDAGDGRGLVVTTGGAQRFLAPGEAKKLVDALNADDGDSVVVNVPPGPAPQVNFDFTALTDSVANLAEASVKSGREEHKQVMEAVAGLTEAIVDIGRLIKVLISAVKDNAADAATGRGGSRSSKAAATDGV